MFYNNLNYPQQMSQYPMNYMNQQQNNLKGRPVSSLEEARVANIDFDGSLFIFPDIANKKIYTKQIKLDGTALLNIYSLMEDTSPIPSYVTKEEFDETIKNLELTFGNKGKENSDATNSSQSSRKPAISF